MTIGMKDKIAHFIINYRGKRLLPELLEGIKNEEGDIYIVNNDKPEDLENIDIGRAQIIQNKKNLSFSQTVNNILSFAIENGYKYISILNNDIYFITPFTDKMISFMEEKDIAIAGPVIVYGDMPEIVQSCGVIATVDGRVEDKYNGLFIKYLQNKDIKSPFAVSFAAVFLNMEKIGNMKMDESFKSYFEDVDFCLKIKAKGGKIEINKNVMVAHYGSSSFSLFSKKKIYFTTINRLRLFLKHQPMEIFLRYWQIEKMILLKKYLIKKYPFMFIQLLIHSSFIYLKYLCLRLFGKIDGFVFPIISLPPSKIMKYYNIQDAFYIKSFSKNMPVLVLPEGVIVYNEKMKIIGNGKFEIVCSNKIELKLYGNGIIKINGKKEFIMEESIFEIDNIVNFELLEGDVYIDYAVCKD